ncbi:hypothetical protein ACJX0J_034226, partial [Zea mays]
HHKLTYAMFTCCLGIFGLLDDSTFLYNIIYIDQPNFIGAKKEQENRGVRVPAGAGNEADKQGLFTIILCLFLITYCCMHNSFIM